MSKSLPFFVMLNHPSCTGNYLPMECGDGSEFGLARFATQKEAETAAKNSVLGGLYGFEVFQIGYGEVSA
jgi:hypothetical protein